MKQMYLNRINAQERFENGPKTVRVKSRIGSRLVRCGLDSFLTRFCLISLFLILMGGFTTEVWGRTGTGTWTAKVSCSKGGGTATATVWRYNVASSDDNVSSASSSNSTVKTASHTEKTSLSNWALDCYYPAYTTSVPDGYSFDGWYGTDGKRASTATTFYPREGSGILSHGATDDNWSYQYDARFTKVTVSSAGSASAISFNHPETKTVTLYFPVSNNADAKADFNAPTIEANTGWSISSWSLNTSTHKVEVVCSYTASSDISKGAHSATVTLTSKANKSNTGTVTANVDLTPTLTYNNGSVDISVSDADKTTLNVANLKTAYKGADNVAGDGTITYALKTANSNVSLTSAGIFYAKATGTYTIVASATKGRYYAKTAEFTVTVGKRTPTFTWKSFNHIYASDTLKNVAQAKYNGNNVVGLNYSYGSNSKIVVVDGTKLRVQNAGFTSATNVTISVSTDSTDYYKAGSDTHTYLIEPKATPVFKLDGVDLPETPVKELTLLIGETANMTFENTDESNNRFTYPTNPTFVSYKHDSVAHTGVIKAVKAGNEEIQFHQTGTTTIFDHLRKIHVYVSKHPVNLTTTLNGGTWKVDSIYDGAIYSIVTPTGEQPALSEVTVTSSNEAVLKKVDGHWKAVGEGEATLTISHPSTNAYWAGQTVTATITVVKHTPVFTWHIPATVNYNRSFAEPVSSTNTDEGCTFTYVSNNTAAINYVNGALRTFEKSASNVAITVTQAGNYKWAEHSETYYVNVEKLADHVPFTMNTSAVRDAVYGGKANKGSISCSAGGTITLDQNGGIIIATANALYYDIHFSGIPNSVSFTYQQSMATSTALGKTGKSFVVYQKSENGDWSELWTSNGAKGDRSEHSVTVNSDKLLPSTRYLRFFFDGTYTGYYKNISVTERTEITGVKKVDFGAANAGSNPTDKTSNINWYNVNPLTLTIEGENASQFTVSPVEIASAKDAYAENVPLKISYIHNRAAVKDTATLVITDGVTTKRIGLRGTTNKLTPDITWVENLTPMQRGVGVKNPATSSVALTYTSSDSTVVKVIGDSIAPLKKGNATITASFDGTSDPMYNSNSSSIAVTVTDVKVQHISWTQNFKRLKWTDDEELSAKNTPDFPLKATVSYYDADKKEEIIINRPITFKSNNNSVVQVLNDTTLHVVGTGTTTLEAHVEGITDSLYEATAVRDVIVREPSLDCESWVLKDKGGSINTINVYEFTLEDEADTIYFDAWREAIKVVIDYTSGDLYLDEVYENESTKNIWHNETKKNTHTSYKALLSRKAKKVRFYTTVGATGYHNFDGVYARRARYVEFKNGKDTMHLTYTKEDAKPGVAKTKSFNVKFSNITDQLEFEFKGGANSKFSVVSPASIGTQCGDHGEATVTVQFLSNDVETYRDTLLIKNLNQLLTVYLEADVDKHHQQITWNPATDLKTTDVVSFDATTSAAAAGLSVRYEVVSGDAASVDAETGALTIIKDGTVTIKATAAGNDSYYDAEPVSKTFIISKVTPEITTVPTAATMTLPNTNLSDCALTGGAASVKGSFAWADNTINATYNNTGYTVTFTPENTNWYSSVSCVVVVPVNKMVQTITWNFTELEIYPNAQITFDASTNAGLPVSYSSSDDAVAYVDGDNKLLIIRGGEVTITASQGGNETYAAAEPVSKTLTINRFAPTIVTLPNASSMKIGRVLSDASLKDGRAELNGEKVEGSFTWVDGNTTVMDVAGTFSKQIVFNPANSNYYEPVYGTMSVTVEKYAPIVTADLQATDIDYGQTLSQSQLSGEITATDSVKIPSEVVSGTYGWKDGSAILNAGSQQATVVFSPSNTDWYQPVEFEVSVTVNPIVADYTAVAHLVLGQTLSEARLDNTSRFNGQEILGSVEWDDSAEDMSYLDYRPILNDSRTFTVKFYSVPGSNFADGTAICTLDVLEGYVFNGEGANDATSWNEDENWSTGTQPEETDLVVISANVDVTGNVEVGGLTINAGYTVTVKNGATLEVGNQNSMYRETYGDIHVEEGGKLILGAGTVDVNNLYLDASLGGRSSSTNDFIYAKSAQVNNVAMMNVHADAYFDVALDPNGACTQGWYTFTVPFPVNVMTGVARFQNGALNTNLRNEVNYAIMDYHEDIRANGQYGWKKYRGDMQPGVCYTMTIDNYYNVYRFTKVSGVSLTNTTAVTMTATEGTGGPENKGWNCIGNGSFNYAKLVAEGIEKVQIYDHYTNSYSPISIDDKAFIVGSTFFVQAITDNSTMSYSPEVSESMYAPKRAAGREISEFLLHLTREGENTYSDALYLSASEEAANIYEAGRDLSKFEVSTKLAQIWADAYGLKLCDVEAPLVNDQAIIPISIYSPTTATYTLDAVQMPNDASLYLMYEGTVVWNLSQSAYTLDMTRGTTTGYSLLVMAEAPSVTTGVDAVQNETGKVEKIILNGNLYILRDGEMYDATGKKVK